MKYLLLVVVCLNCFMAYVNYKQSKKDLRQAKERLEQIKKWSDGL